ncbi:FCD domain-containing protein [Epidermidibacterium keratini]|uniref:FCD domain-containing protein n=1 Tax=Epidermidibacterium keratini TaxID=1891644 RepID=A0A7L4YUP6_9ACTN|nr:FCD domain-containing protein [Epidermidibacterium keratini]
METRLVSEQVTDELRRSILTGALAPGERLSLRGLAELLDVSFIPVRDALRVLGGEGLVINSPGRSARVAPLDPDELHGIYRVRRLLEPDLARRACTLLTDAELDDLMVQATALGAPESSIDDIYDDHRAFHQALLAPAASAWDRRIMMMLTGAAERYVRIGFRLLDPDPQEHDRRMVAHQDLVVAFRERTPEVAAVALDAHLAENERIAVETLARMAEQ